MTLIELWQTPPKTRLMPSYIHRIKDDPLDLEEMVVLGANTRLRDAYQQVDHDDDRGCW